MIAGLNNQHLFDCCQLVDLDKNKYINKCNELPYQRKIVILDNKRKKHSGVSLTLRALAKRQQPPLSTTTLLGVWRRFNEGQLQGHFLKNPNQKIFCSQSKQKNS